MWHASVMAADEATAWAMAERALQGVGDTSLGEWRERGKAVHLRRRLSRREAYRVNRVRDIRDTGEERTRLAALFRDAPWLRARV